MFWRGVALAVVAVLLCGCETERNGLDYSAVMRKVGPPKAGQARIVVLREKGYGGIVDGGWNVQLDEAPMRSLKTGTYVYVDRPAGHHQLTATEAAFPGVTRNNMTAESGRTYFFVARMSERKTALIATSSSGLLGLAVGTVITAGYKNPGPLDFFPLEEVAARQNRGPPAGRIGLAGRCGGAPSGAPGPKRVISGRPGAYPPPKPAQFPCFL
jgi:hypothetical protein